MMSASGRAVATGVLSYQRVFHTPPLYRYSNDGRVRLWQATACADGTTTTRYGFVGDGYRLTSTKNTFANGSEALYNVLDRYRAQITKKRYVRHAPGTPLPLSSSPPAPVIASHETPVVVEPQLEGIECIAWWDATAEYAQVYLPRQQTFIDEEHYSTFGALRRSVTQLLRKNPHISLCGTLYSPTTRKTVEIPSDKRCVDLYLYVHDVHDQRTPEAPLTERLEVLRKILPCQVGDGHVDERVVSLTRIVADSESEVDIHSRIYRQSGFRCVRRRYANAQHGPGFAGYRLHTETPAPRGGTGR